MKLNKENFRKLIVENLIISKGLKYHVDNSIPLCENIYRPGSYSFFELVKEARDWYSKGYLTLMKEDIDIINSELGNFGHYNGRQVALDYPISQEADMMMSTLDKGYEYSHEILARIFTNEFGNEIEIEVRDAVTDDFLEGEEPYNGVHVRMTGPDSEVGNIMTKMEARMLLSLLYDYFCEEDHCDLQEGKRKRKKKKKKKKKSGSYYKGKKVKLNKPKRGGSKKFYVYVKNPKTGNIKKIEFGAKGMTTGLRDPARRKSFKARHNCEDKNDKTKAGYWACRIGRYPKVTGAPYTTWW
jgi:hypothetical protein